MKNELPTYLLDLQQPSTCPICGARSQFEVLSHETNSNQHHFCFNATCKYEFIGEFEAGESLMPPSAEASSGN